MEESNVEWQEATPESPPQEKSVAVKEDKPKDIMLKEGLLNPQTSSEQWRVAEMALKSEALPKIFKNVPQVVMAFQFLRGHGFDPIVGIRQCAIINGSLSLWGELPKALVDRSGLMSEFHEFHFDKEYKVISFENKNLATEAWGSLTSVRRGNAAQMVVRQFTIDDAKKAGLWGKSGPWTQYPKRMLQMKARSWALKDAFPDVLAGVAITEYDFGTEGEAPQVDTPLANQINAQYGESE